MMRIFRILWKKVSSKERVRRPKHRRVAAKSIPVHVVAKVGLHCVQPDRIPQTIHELALLHVVERSPPETPGCPESGLPTETGVFNVTGYLCYLNSWIQAVLDTPIGRKLNRTRSVSQCYVHSNAVCVCVLIRGFMPLG